MWRAVQVSVWQRRGLTYWRYTATSEVKVQGQVRTGLVCGKQTLDSESERTVCRFNLTVKDKSWISFDICKRLSRSRAEDSSPGATPWWITVCDRSKQCKQHKQSQQSKPRRPHAWIKQRSSHSSQGLKPRRAPSTSASTGRGLPRDARRAATPPWITKSDRL